MADPGGRPIDCPNYRCTLILPVYGAAGIIALTVERLKTFVADHPEWCVLLVCDGCAATAAVIRPLLANTSPAIAMEHYESNRGKGYALRHGLNLATTPYCVYTDADLAYDPEEAVKIFRLLENGADVAVVNRASTDSRFVISPRDFPKIYKRHLMSRSFNWWLRQMLPITILDTQAGLKGVTASAWKTLGPQMTMDGFFFDVEFLARAGAAHLRIEETPVMVTYIDPTTVEMVRDGWAMMKDTLRLRRSLRKSAKRARGLLLQPIEAPDPVVV